jgi:hypothetical protein
MSIANIKIPSETVKELQNYTGEKTGQKAIQKALLYFIKEARQRRITQVLQKVSFKKGFDPLKLRHHER